MVAPARVMPDAAERLAELSPADGGPAWLRAARSEALARLRNAGLPHRRDEYWKFTDPAPLNAAVPSPAPRFEIGAPPVFDTIPRYRIVFVDGVLDPDASDRGGLAHVEITPLADTPEIHWAQGIYGSLEAAAQSPVPRPFAILNTAMASEGLLIRVTGRPDKPISLVYVHKSEDSDAIVRHCIKLESGSDLTLLENGPVAARSNIALEVDVAAGATFHHVRAQGRDHKRQAVTHLFARVAEGGLLKSFTLTANGALTRNEAVIVLAGPGASAHVAGAAVGDGAFHHDDTVFIDHAAPDCESRQVFKKVLRNGAVGVFQGKILVRAGAQRTDGYQLSQGLLLDEDSQLLAKPELEIYADDVKCSHGSTVGAIDEEALFYLVSRGVPREEARNLLLLAFLAEAMDEIGDEALRAEVVSRTEGWLQRRRR